MEKAGKVDSQARGAMADIVMSCDFGMLLVYCEEVLKPTNHNREEK